MTKKHSPVLVKISISRIKSRFSWAFESDLIGAPPMCEPDFKPPSVRVIRRARQAMGIRIDAGQRTWRWAVEKRITGLV